MILLFGGTTEGRKAAEVLEEAGMPYYYSTKTGEQMVTLHNGITVSGAMDQKAMTDFCLRHDIRLMIDAAHPFATLLHRTISLAAETLSLKVIRYERCYPARDKDIVWIDDYSEIPHDIGWLLATTGVQSIAKLKPLEKKMRISYRILKRQSSIDMAKAQGATDDQLCYYDGATDIPVAADAILLKESGLSGGYLEKIKAARQRDMRIIVLKRPEMPKEFVTCNGPHGMRLEVERLLPDFFALHSGLTTGTCATAAAIAAACKLLRGTTPQQVPVVLPNGETIAVNVGYGENDAYCIKQAGDDPDVTNGITVRATVQRAVQMEILGGEGVGRFTLPGFDYPPGEPAINKGPRQMICQNLSVFDEPLRVTISVPGGAEIAQRTFNPRLGIEGGISIIGVSGIVKPFSEEAFIASIGKCMQVAKACGTERVVINSGAKSENIIRQHYPSLPRQAFVQYGNYIGETLKIANELGINSITLGVMLGKAVKLAAGHLDTHSRRATMDLKFISRMLREADINLDISQLTLARELWEKIPARQLQTFAQVVIRHCYEQCTPWFPHGELTILLIDENGKIYS